MSWGSRWPTCPECGSDEVWVGDEPALYCGTCDCEWYEALTASGHRIDLELPKLRPRPWTLANLGQPSDERRWPMIIDEDEQAVEELIRRKSRSRTGKSRPIHR